MESHFRAVTVPAGLRRGDPEPYKWGTPSPWCTTRKDLIRYDKYLHKWKNVATSLDSKELDKICWVDQFQYDSGSQFGVPREAKNSKRVMYGVLMKKGNQRRDSRIDLMKKNWLKGPGHESSPNTPRSMPDVNAASHLEEDDELAPDVPEKQRTLIADLSPMAKVWRIEDDSVAGDEVLMNPTAQPALTPHILPADAGNAKFWQFHEPRGDSPTSFRQMSASPSARSQLSTSIGPMSGTMPKFLPSPEPPNYMDSPRSVPRSIKSMLSHNLEPEDDEVDELIEWSRQISFEDYVAQSMS